MPANPNRHLQVNNAGDDRALAVVVALNEVFTAFYSKAVTLDRHFVRTIDHGKSASFPMFGRGPEADYHVPGTDILGDLQPVAEQIISVDDFLVTSRFVAEIDEILGNFQVRGPYTEAMGHELARKFDVNVLRTGIKAARSTNPVAGEPGGSVVTAANSKTNGVALAESLVEAARILDEKEIPEDGRTAFIRPLQYQALLRDAKDFIDTDLNPEGNGSKASGNIYQINGIRLVKTTRVPSTNTTGAAKTKVKYQGDFTRTTALVMNSMAVGTVKMKDITFDTEEQKSRLGWLMLAKMLVGHGVLRPDCAIEVQDTV
jgi:hypothetical protein